MVKFTFASAFLTLTTLFAFVFAAPTVAQNYAVRNADTSLFLYTDGKEKLGQNVTTTSDFNLGVTSVSININPGGSGSYCTVQGNAGYYVAVTSNAAGQSLIWSVNEYPWLFTKTGGPGQYTITAIGTYLGWFSQANSGGFTLSPLGGAPGSEFVIMSA